MKILEIAPFSSGICGVWARISVETQLLAKKGHEVYVFSSDIHRGEGKTDIACAEEVIDKVKVKRFPTKFSLGQNTFFWNCKKEALRLNPDVIITHVYRHYHSTIALKIAKKLKIPCILVTHAPFLDVKTRGWKLSLIAWIYDTFIGKRILKEYSRIFVISKWELPYLYKLGVKREKIVYVPNGIPEEFFKIKPKKFKKDSKKKILFLGRIAEIKNLEVLIKAIKLISSKRNLVLNLVGPVEEPYETKIKLLIQHLNLGGRVHFLGPIYKLKEKISLIDANDLFVLPSKREGMPQALIEAMARSKIVIGSNIPSIKDIIQDSSNGKLFKVDSPEDLAEKIMALLDESLQNKKIAKNARKSVEQFSWSNLISYIEDTLKKEISSNPSRYIL
jgi:1,2-diacylglycerol 3-alpha-glucosyltransferase